MGTQWTRRNLLALRHRLPRRREAIKLAFLGAACTLQAVGSAHASGIPFATDRPRTWQFSSDFVCTYDSFGQNLELNHDIRACDSHGTQVAEPGTTIFVRISHC